MPKRPRDKRLSTIASDVAENAEATARATALSQRVDASLFTVDKAPVTKRARGGPSGVVGASASASSSAELITTALAAVSRVKYMQPAKVAPPLVISASARKAHEVRAARAVAAVAAPPAHGVESGAGGVMSTGFFDPWAPVAPAPALPGGEASLRPWVSLSASASSLRGIAAGPLARVLSTPAGAGSSYHPTVGDHQRALAAALDVETHASKASRRRLAALGEEGGIRETAEEAAASSKRRATIVAAGVIIDDAEDEDDDEEKAKTTLADVGAGADTEMGAAASMVRGPKAKKDRAARIAAIKAKRKAEAVLLATAVDRAIEDVAAEEAAVAARGPERRASRKVIAIAGDARVIAAAAPLLDVPLSEELTGSLRTIRPLTGGQLLLAAMPALSRRGDVGRRARIPHVLARERADGSGPELVRFSAGAVRASTGRKNPWKVYEFPRRCNFEPAEDAVRDAQARGQVRGQVPGITLNFAAAEAARMKVKKEKDSGLKALTK